MKQYLFQRQEMQIPKENAFLGLKMSNKDSLTNFLENYFKITSNNLNEIMNFIKKDSEIKKIIYDLPTMISSELEYVQISLDFMKETDFNEKILEITIFSELDEKLLLEKEDTITDKIIDKYPKTTLEYIILVDPYVRE